MPNDGQVSPRSIAHVECETKPWLHMQNAMTWKLFGLYSTHSLLRAEYEGQKRPRTPIGTSKDVKLGSIQTGIGKEPSISAECLSGVA